MRRATRAISVEDRCVEIHDRMSSHEPKPGSGCDEPSAIRLAAIKPIGMPTAMTARTSSAPAKRGQEPEGRDWLPAARVRSMVIGLPG